MPLSRLNCCSTAAVWLKFVKSFKKSVYILQFHRLWTRNPELFHVTNHITPRQVTAVIWDVILQIFTHNVEKTRGFPEVSFMITEVIRICSYLFIIKKDHRFPRNSAPIFENQFKNNPTHNAKIESWQVYKRLTRVNIALVNTVFLNIWTSYSSKASRARVYTCGNFYQQNLWKGVPSWGTRDQ